MPHYAPCPGLICSMGRSSTGISSVPGGSSEEDPLPLSMDCASWLPPEGPVGTGALVMRDQLSPAGSSFSTRLADLALAQGDGRRLLGELHFFGKFVEVSGGVGARANTKMRVVGWSL